MSFDACILSGMETEQITHAKASPSDYRRWSHCPGAITLQAKLIRDGLIPEYEEGGEAAQEGTGCTT